MPTTSPPGPTFRPASFPLTHLWFLYVLAIFYVAVAPLHLLCVRITRTAAGHAIAHALRAVVSHDLGRWVLVAPTAAGLLLHPTWLPWFGIPTPDQSLYPNVAALLAFGSAFGAGWLVQPLRNGLAAYATHWRSALFAALVGTLVCLCWVGTSPSFDPGIAAGGIARAFFAALYASTAWAWVFALLGVVLTFADRPSPPYRYLADASLWIYVAHLPLVAAGQVLMSRVGAPIWLELPATVGGSLALLLLAYRFAIRGTRLGRLLGFSAPVQRDAPIDAHLDALTPGRLADRY